LRTSGDFVRLLWQERSSAILRTPDAEAAGPAMQAAVRGGFRVVEFTLSTPGAFDLIEEFARSPELVVGAGTVLRPDEAEEAVARGASFLVSPVVDPEVIAAAGELGVAIMPGCQTPTEMLLALRTGAPLQKLFPAPPDGPAWVRACLGPLPELRIVPTSGADERNAAEYLSAGAWAVGFVTPLFRPELLAERDWPALEARARELRAAAASVVR
jgi:2-dehydro-3-deoxyphosphogluconate aldolase/(4S)-4-hydroxy-2-oxoglutarate aldolase